jgi:BlaI family penicillinase repressor
MRKRKLQGLSPAETEVLRLVWSLERATVQQVCHRLPAKRTIAYATVQTLLRRLEAKGYVKHDVEGKAHVFFPAVKRDDVVRRSVGDFVERLFGGDPIPLVQYLAEHGKITAEDIERLKRLVDEKQWSAIEEKQRWTRH